MRIQLLPALEVLAPNLGPDFLLVDHQQDQPGAPTKQAVGHIHDLPAVGGMDELLGPESVAAVGTHRLRPVPRVLGSDVIDPSQAGSRS